MGSFFWIMTSKVMETRAIIPIHDLQTLNGVLGEAKSFIHKDGSVQVAGELWTARSEAPIRNGEKVRVIGRDGFILLVESIDVDSD
jgi:membrane-bound serine protease (ClpP class)